MKLVIFEGIDRTGKNTQINNLINKYSNVNIRHWRAPDSKSHINSQYAQKLKFHQEFNNYLIEKRLNNSDLLIWNRSHVGEYCYGSLYRNTKSDWIFDLEKIYKFYEDNNVYLINFYADPEFILYKDDGKSLGRTLELKQKEINLFQEAVDLSHIINKINIKVNNKNDDFIPEQEIFGKILDFIDD